MIDLWSETEFIPVGDLYMNKNSNGKLYTKEEYKQLLLENQKQLEAEQKIKEAEEIVDEVKQETKQTNRGHKKSKRK
jgi:hypothetical protein